MSLDDIRAREQAATEGPWELAGGNEWLSPLGIDVGSEDESYRPTLLAKDADFIANARTDIPKLLAALDAVLAIHAPVEIEPSDTICRGCSTQRGAGDNVRFFPFIDYPCPTVRAITEALR